jgi:hypothetical protein
VNHYQTVRCEPFFFQPKFEQLTANKDATISFEPFSFNHSSKPFLRQPFFTDSFRCSV